MGAKAATRRWVFQRGEVAERSKAAVLKVAGTDAICRFYTNSSCLLAKPALVDRQLERIAADWTVLGEVQSRYTTLDLLPWEY